MSPQEDKYQMMPSITGKFGKKKYGDLDVSKRERKRAKQNLDKANPINEALKFRNSLKEIRTFERYLVCHLNLSNSIRTNNR